MSVSATYYEKTGKNLWEETYRTEDPETVYQRLASELIRKHYWKAPSVGRIVEEPDYSTGLRKITVYSQMEFGDGVHKYKAVYKVNI